MWQLSYLWTLVPTVAITWVVNGLIVVGIVGVCAAWFAKWIPFVSAYRGPVQLVGIVCLVLGVYMKGGADVEIRQRNEVAELEAKVKVSEQKSKEANTKLDDAIKEKNKAIKDVQIVIKDRISKSSEKMDAVCKVDAEAISILNDAAKNVKGAK